MNVDTQALQDFAGLVGKVGVLKGSVRYALDEGVLNSCCGERLVDALEDAEFELIQFVYPGVTRSQASQLFCDETRKEVRLMKEGDFPPTAFEPPCNRHG